MHLFWYNSREEHAGIRPHAGVRPLTLNDPYYVPVKLAGQLAQLPVVGKLPEMHDSSWANCLSFRL